MLVSFSFLFFFSSFLSVCLYSFVRTALPASLTVSNVCLLLLIYLLTSPSHLIPIPNLPSHLISLHHPSFLARGTPLGTRGETPPPLHRVIAHARAHRAPSRPPVIAVCVCVCVAFLP